MLTLKEIKTIFDEAEQEFNDQEEPKKVDSELALNFNDGENNE